jgi:hypothetical protein
MDVPKKRAQHGQKPFRILVRAIPVNEGCCCKSVAEIMYARSVPIASPSKPDLPGSRIKGNVNLRSRKAFTPARNEEI